jgi:hypothetical protein
MAAEEPPLISSIGRRHGETNELGYTLKSIKEHAIRAGVQRVNRHAFKTSAAVLRARFRVLLRAAAGAAARERLKSIPIVPHLVRAADLHGVRIVAPQYRIRAVGTRE